MKNLWAAISALVCLAGCASIATERNALCMHLDRFAQSIGPGEHRSLAFHTAWGTNFRDDPDPALFATRCIHHEYAPSKAVCTYLMTHGAVEFSGSNTASTLACLASDTTFGPNIEMSSGEFHVRYGTSDRGTLIKVEFLEDTVLGGMVLRIEANGY